MPETSALTLLPPKPIDASASASYSPSTDSSFQDTLTSAQQRQSSSKPDDTSTADTAATAKKQTKRTKPKASPVADKNAAEEDSTDDPETAEAAALKKADMPDSPDAEKVVVPKQADSATVVKDPTAKIVTPVAIVAPAQHSAVAQTPDQPTAAPMKLAERKATVAKPVNLDQSKDKENATAAPAKSASTDVSQVAAAASASTAAPTTKPAPFCPDNADSSQTPDDANAQPQAKAQPIPTSGTPTDTAAATPALPQALPAEDGTDSISHTAPLADGSPISSPFEQQLQRVLAPIAAKAEAPAPAPAQTATEAQFVDANHPGIVTGVHTQLLPNGGTMQLHLDPPDLGALQVTVQMRDGVMTAAFQTSNEQATRMLSHSLSQLKTALETTGVSVERMHVQQAPRQESRGSTGGDSQQQNAQDPEQQQQARQEQQRRQMLQRMWNKLAGQPDPLDLVA